MKRGVHGPPILASVVLVIASACGGLGAVTTPTAPPGVAFHTFTTGTLDLPSPDWLAAGAGSIWVKLDSGRILRVDPQSMDILATVERPAGSEEFDVCQGLAFAGDAAWSCAGPDVVRIDPSTNLAVIQPIRKIRDQGNIPFVSDRLWFLTGEGDQLVGIDPQTGSAGNAIALGSACSDVDGSAGVLWVACERDNMVRRVDIAQGAVSDEIAIGSPTHVAVSADRVWVAAASGIVTIQATSFAVSEPVATPGTVHRMRVGSSGVWIRAGAPYLTLLGLDGSVVGVWTSPALDPGDVVESDGVVWVTDSEEGTLTRADILPGG